MKKSVAITAGVIIVGAAAWLGGTWYTGQRLAEESTVRLERLNAELARAFPDLQLRFDELSAERGFFSTHARYALTGKTGSVRNAKDEALEFDARIDHGPLPLGALARGHFLPSMAFVQTEMVPTPSSQPAFDAAQGKNPLSGNVVLHYGGDASVQAEVPAMKYPEERAEFGGARFDGKILKRFEGVQGELVTEPLSVIASKTDDAADTHIELGKITMTVDSREGPSGLQLGTGSLKLASMTVKRGNDSTVQVKDFVYHGVNKESDGLLNGELGYNAASILVDGAELGSQQVTFKYSRVNAAKFKAAMDLSAKLTEQNQRDGQASNGLTAEQSRQLAALGMDMLADNPTLALDPVIWKNDKGASQLNLSVTLVAPQNPQATGLELVRQVMQPLDAKLVLSKPMMTALGTNVLQSQGLSPEQAAQQVGRQINTMAGMAQMLNLAQLQGEDLVTSLLIKNGALTLNGKELPLDALQGMLPH